MRELPLAKDVLSLLRRVRLRLKSGQSRASNGERIITATTNSLIIEDGPAMLLEIRVKPVAAAEVRPRGAWGPFSRFRRSV